MGQFSWLDCKTKEQIVDDLARKVYLLVPKEFGGGHIEETCYDGYGHFGEYDVYELVADWNKEFIPKMLQLSESDKWHGRIDDFDTLNLEAFYEGKPFMCHPNTPYMYEKRNVGICMACYDEDNVRLPYPIKITYDKNAVYEECEPSPSDPNQGWPPEDFDYDDYEEEDDDTKYNEWQENLLWNLLKDHIGHRVEIACYGDSDNPASITLEDMDTNEVILDAGIYTICTREDI